MQHKFVMNCYSKNVNKSSTSEIFKVEVSITGINQQYLKKIDKILIKIHVRQLDSQN